MNINHKKNTAYYLAFPMVNSASPENFATGASVTDTAYYKDGAGVWTALPITDTASEIGSTGMYEIDLTAAEMNYDKVLIKFTASGAADTAFLFDMSAVNIDDIPTATENADALLNRDMSAVTVTNTRSPINAFRFLRNRWAVVGTALTVYEEDDSTSAWTGVVTPDATADPITGSNPAGGS